MQESDDLWRGCTLLYQYGKLNKVCLNSHPEARFWCILIKTLQLINGSVDLADNHIPVTSTKLTNYLHCMHAPQNEPFPFSVNFVLYS